MNPIRRRRQPGTKSLDTPFLDNFIGGNLRSGWISSPGAWVVSGGVATCTPTLGGELLTNPGGEGGFTGGIMTDWTATGVPTGADETTIIHGGAHSQKITTAVNPGGIRQAVTSANNWYWASGWIYQDSASINVHLTLAIDNYTGTTTGAWKQIFTGGRGGANFVWIYGNGGTKVYYIDDVSVMQITLASAGAYRKVAGVNYRVLVKPSAIPVLGGNASSPFGVWICVDNPNNPQNGVLAFYAHNIVYLEKVVNGTWTSVASVGKSPNVDSVLEGLRADTGYSVWFNGAQAIAPQTITGLGAVPYCGMFAVSNNTPIKLFDIRPEVKNTLLYGDSKTVSLGIPWIFTRPFHLVPAPMATAGVTVAGRQSTVDADLAASSGTPDLILSNLGTNDVADVAVFTGDGVWAVGAEATWLANYQYILSAFNTKWPNAQVYLMRPWRRGVYTNSFAAIASKIDTLVAGNSFVHLGPDERIWLENGDDGATYTTDGTHYTGSGVELCQNQWLQLLGVI